MTLPDRPINDFIKNEHVGGAVVYNSTLGLDLLRLGVSVVSTGPRTVYSDLVSTDLTHVETSHPGAERVKELLEKLAYGQYQLEELARWETLERLFHLHGVRGDW